ncbi:MAG TPA: hypothetical protein VMG13_21835 [Trebonia sp.]|nr:hypothetical protein [Trebonia sp.]
MPTPACWAMASSATGPPGAAANAARAAVMSFSRLRRALPAGLACVQNAYSLVFCGDEDTLHLCTGAGIAWVPFFPLGGALPGSPR